MELLPPKMLARLEQTCAYFSGALDAAARERLRRATRCARLRTHAANVPSLAAAVQRYCTTALDTPEEALEALVTACTPALLDAAKGEALRGRGFNGRVLQDLPLGMPPAGEERFWRAYLRARARWLGTLSAHERGKLHDGWALDPTPRATVAALRLARESRGMLSSDDVVTLLHTLSGSINLDEAQELAEDEEATTSELVAAFDSARELAGFDVEVLLTLAKHLSDRTWYQPHHPELREMCCQHVHNTFRARTVHALCMSSLREPLGTHMMAFINIYNTGPNRFPCPSPPTTSKFAAALKAAPQLTAAWQGMLRAAVPWLQESEGWGYALHLRAHQILHDNELEQGVDVDLFSVQAFLVTRSLQLGWRALAKQFESIEGLAALFADLFQMVSAYQQAGRFVQQWSQRMMAQYRSHGFAYDDYDDYDD